MRNILIAVICYWHTCTVIQSLIAACATPESGSESAMLISERRNQGPGKVFMRECVLEGQTPALEWKKTAVFSQEAKK